VNSIRLRYVLRERDVRGQQGETVLSIYRDLGVVPKGEREDNYNKTPENLSNYKLVLPGDVVVNKMKAWQGSIAVSDFRGIVSGDYLVCEVTAPADRSYIHHILRSNVLIREYGRRAKGVRPQQWRLYWDDLADISIPMPPLPEQARVGRFLNGEIARINELITKKRRLNQLLAEKLNAYIAREAAKGEHIKIGRVLEFVTSGPRGWADRVATEGVPFIRSANLHSDRIQLRLDNLALVQPIETEEARRTRVRAGDVVIGITGANVGWVGLVDNHLIGSFISQHVALLRPTPLVSPEWLAYSLLSPRCRQQLLGSQYGGTKQQLSLEDLKEVVISMPGRREQDYVTGQLKRMADVVAMLRSKLTRQITLLHEHKQSLIAGVITGKVHTRERWGALD
jgi:type I restriction enzyme, S subunit